MLLQQDMFPAADAIFAPPVYWTHTQLVAAATIAFESIHNSSFMARINADIRVKEALSAKAEAAQVLDRLKNLLDNQVGSKFLPTLVSDTGENRIHEAKDTPLNLQMQMIDD
ncbi:hypothetical protein K7X08_030655 [Anisodus acutangulus]|uniref:Uncharacterized protein n=1 Tax=Anisodus acutangulus TaxID=402998 RepID=A0A9Q1L789_9SOLA|nr:hypothetical protein K7X08_030655 [Anisodus acutangulus]